jgi:glycine oxidase
MSDESVQVKPLHIGIAGAGLLGRLLAWKLLRAGHSVSIFDRDEIHGEQSAARVAAAMLAPYSELIHGEREVFDWGRETLTIWPQWLKELQEQTGREVVHQQRGSIVVAHSADQNLLTDFFQQLRIRAADHFDKIEFCNAQRLQQLEEDLQLFSQGIYLAEEGCLDNWGLLPVLAKAILDAGGQWHSGVNVDSVNPHELIVDGVSHNFHLAIDARGFGAKHQFAGLRGVRGEVLWVNAPDVHLSRPVRLLHPRYQLYISPKPDQVYVIGATEIESESRSPITVRSSLELQSALYSVHKGFAEATVLRAYANLRPAFADNFPRIESESGLLRVNGLYRHGYLLAPVVVNNVLSQIVESYHAIAY